MEPCADSSLCNNGCMIFHLLMDIMLLSECTPSIIHSQATFLNSVKAVESKPSAEFNRILLRSVLHLA